MMSLEDVNYQLDWVTYEIEYLKKLELARIDQALFEVEINLIILELGLWP